MLLNSKLKIYLCHFQESKKKNTFIPSTNIVESRRSMISAIQEVVGKGGRSQAIIYLDLSTEGFKYHF